MGRGCELAGCTRWDAEPHSACGTVYACPPHWALIELLTTQYQAPERNVR